MITILSFGILSLVTMLAALVASPLFAGNHDHTAGEVIRGRYIVVLHWDASPVGVAEAHGVIRTHTYSYALNGFAGPIPDAKLHALKNDPRVKSVEPDRIVQVPEGSARAPGKGGGGKSKKQLLPTGIDDIDADLSPMANIDGVDDRVDVDIAIIDTGIDPDHPDLNVFDHSRCTGTGANSDEHGHGTHVAGSAAALYNKEGVVGVAPGARLWGVKVLDANGSGSLGCVIAGVDYVTSNAAEIEVANMSLGFQGSSSALDAAIANSVAAGIFYAVAAGNSSMDAAAFSPANHPDVLTVSAITDTDGQVGGLGPPSSWGGQDRNFDGIDDGLDDTFAWFSNFGSVIELTAPGVDIHSTWLAGGYNTISGTSMASPHAAGAAALYIANNPGATPAAVGDALVNAGECADGAVHGGNNCSTEWPADPDADLPSLNEPLLKAGSPDLTDVAIVAMSAPVSVAPGDGVNVTVTVKNVGNQEIPYDIMVTLADTPPSGGTAGTVSSPQTVAGLSAGASTDLIYTWNTNGASLGAHTLTGSHNFTDDAGANDSMSSMAAVEEPLTDVAVFSVSAPASVVQGDIVSVTVAVQNAGNQDVAVSFDVNLTDETDTVLIATQTVTSLAAGASIDLVYSWNTSGVSLGDHTLKASHNFVDDDSANDAAATTVSVTVIPVVKVVPGWFGEENQGAGTAIADINGNGLLDLVVFNVDKPPGKNQGYYRIGWSLDGDGDVTGGWSEIKSVPGWFGNENQGAGIAVADINGNGQPELVVFHVDNPAGENQGYYRIGWDLDANGDVTVGWSDVGLVPGWFGNEDGGAGIAIADINGNPRPELVVFHVDNPAGENQGYYRIGWDLDANGNVTGGWSEVELVPGWFGEENQGAGIAIAGINGNLQPDLVVFHLDNPIGENQGYYRIGWDLDANGNVTGGWSDAQVVPGWFGQESQGAGIALADLTGNNQYDLLIFHVDNLPGENQGYSRVVFDLPVAGGGG